MYIKGKKTKVAEYLLNLGRANRDDQISGLDMVVHNMEYTMAKKNLSQLINATLQDHILQELMNYIQHGCPIHCQELSPDAQSYFKYRDEL